MKTTEILQREHELISFAADRIDATARAIARGDAVSAARTAGLVSALRVLGERCHHPKEQRILFPALAAHGVPRRTGVLREMADEHERIRRYLVEMADSSPYLGLSSEARARFCTAARACTTLLKQHVGRESDALFPLIEALLDHREDTLLAKRFTAEAPRSEEAVRELAPTSEPR